MINRREFMIFAIIAGGGCLAPAKAFAYDSVAFKGDYFGRDIDLVASPSEVIPMGRYPYSILYSIDADLTESDRSLTLFDVENGDRTRREDQLRENGSKDYLRNRYQIPKDQNNLSLRIDVGSPEKSSLESLSEIERITGSPALFFDGGFENLGETYRALGNLLGESKCYDMADYIDDTVSLVLKRRPLLSTANKKKIYIASDAAGLGFETFNYLQTNVFDYLNCTCINNESQLTSGCDSGNAVFDLNAIMDLSPDYIIFKDVEPTTFVDRISPARFLWRRAPQLSSGHAFCVPNTEFSWIGTPLVSQCLGVLWLGSIMYPEHYANINIAEKARQFYSLFVHFEESEDYYNNFLADRKIKL